jgi:outer membrane protein OmpU
MKKVLLATTALALSAGMAAAEVKFSGDARMGLNYNSGGSAVPNGNTVRLEKRFTLNIDGSTTTDGGVTLGARVRIRSDEADGGNKAPLRSLKEIIDASPLSAAEKDFLNGLNLSDRFASPVTTGVSGARVFASFAGLTVAAGNINGAWESMPNLYAPSVGLTGLGWHGLISNVSAATEGDRHFDWDSFSSRGNGAEGVEVIYTMGDFTAHVSHSSFGLRNVIGDGQRTAIHAAYTVSGWTFAAGYQDSTINGAVGDARNIEDKWGITVGGKIGNFGVSAGYAQNGTGVNQINKFALSGNVNFDAWTFTAYFAQQDRTPTVAIPGFTPKRETFGIGAIYSLGGGASLQAGLESTTHGTVRGDLGVSFRF